MKSRNTYSAPGLFATPCGSAGALLPWRDAERIRHLSPLVHNGYPMAIEDYAMIGDLHTAALISQAGSIDWLCLPRFDTPALAALLGSEDAGRWSLAPNGTVVDVRRSYMPGTFVLQTHWQTDDGEARSGISCRRGTCGRIFVRRIRGSAGGSSFASSSPSGSTMGPPSRGCVRSPTATNLRFSRRRDRMPSSGGARRWHRRAFTMSRSSPSGKARWWTRSSPGIRRTVHPYRP